MFDENLLRLGTGQHLDVVRIDPPVLVQVQAQRFHRPDGDAIVGGPARIVGIVHISAFSRDDLGRDFLNAWHGYPRPANEAQGWRACVNGLLTSRALLAAKRVQQHLQRMVHGRGANLAAARRVREEHPELE